MRHQMGWLIALGALAAAAAGCGPAGPDEAQLLEQVKKGDVKMVIEYLRGCGVPKTEICAPDLATKAKRCEAVAGFITTMRERDLSAATKAAKAEEALATFRTDQKELLQVLKACPDDMRSKVWDMLRAMETVAAK